MIRSILSTAWCVIPSHDPWRAALSLLAAMAMVGGAEGMTSSGEAESAGGLLTDRGRVVFERLGATDRHVYIIGQSHRSAQTGANGPDTVAAQADVYRLGQWLIENQDVELFLPEGFFDARTGALVSSSRGTRPRVAWMDEVTLERRLSDTSIFTSAAKLLWDSCSIRFRQVEDEDLYVRSLDLIASGTDRRSDAEWLADLEHVQERRSAAILQNVVRVVQEEYGEGRIKNRRAVVTVGLAHLNEILRFLREERIEVSSTACPTARCPSYDSELELLEGDFGITVIVPQSLWENRSALRVARLDHLAP